MKDKNKQIIKNLLKNREKIKILCQEFDPSIDASNEFISSISHSFLYGNKEISNIRLLFIYLTLGRCYFDNKKNEWTLIASNSKKTITQPKDIEILNFLTDLIKICYPDIEIRDNSFNLFVYIRNEGTHLSKEGLKKKFKNIIDNLIDQEFKG